jgi:protein gp37
MAARLQAMGQPNYKAGFRLTLHERVLAAPLKWKKPQMIFVNSMSDLFHEEVPFSFIESTFQVMSKASQHTFQVLTKRSERLLEMNDRFNWPENVWMGVSVENGSYAFRIDHLSRTGAKTKFISFEPLLGPISDMSLEKMHWVIVGGESGPGARPMEEEWVVDIRDRCLSSGIPFFFKQWGGFNKKRNGRALVGRVWEELPLAH